MKIRPEKAMWCVVMFDLPVQTKGERKEAAKFRKLLVDAGFSMIQFSVYAKYSPTVHSNMVVEKMIRADLPDEGEVRIFHLTDRQWASAVRIISKRAVSVEKAPEQLTIF